MNTQWVILMKSLEYHGSLTLRKTNHKVQLLPHQFFNFITSLWCPFTSVSHSGLQYSSSINMAVPGWKKKVKLQCFKTGGIKKRLKPDGRIKYSSIPWSACSAMLPNIPLNSLSSAFPRTSTDMFGEQTFNWQQICWCVCCGGQLIDRASEILFFLKSTEVNGGRTKREKKRLTARAEECVCVPYL